MSSFGRALLRSCAPEPLLRSFRARRLVRRAAELARRTEGAADVGSVCDTLWSYLEFRPLQVFSEAVSAFEMVKEIEPRVVCEIGAAGGGTAFLFASFAAPDATIVSIDLAFEPARRRAIARFARNQQVIQCLPADTHDHETLETVERILAGRPIDCLLIDGDHGYEGVRRDLEMYGPLVRDGGLVFFHDIVPSSLMRGGPDTGTYVGGVPQFWREIASRVGHTVELVEGPAQDGYGIGVVVWSNEIARDGLPTGSRAGA